MEGVDPQPKLPVHRLTNLSQTNFVGHLYWPSLALPEDSSLAELCQNSDAELSEDAGTMQDVADLLQATSTKFV